MPSVTLLREHSFEVRMIGNDRFGKGLASDAEQIEILQGADAVIAWGERYPANVLKALPDLRVIARFGVGFDKIDMGVATEHGVVVTITPNSNHETVAEHAMALIMGLAKSIVTGDVTMRRGQWSNHARRPIRGSTLGIVGLGRIGRSLAVRALGMKMRVISAELYPDKDFVETNGIEIVDLDTLLGQAEFVSLNCPLNNETRGLINKNTLSLMRPNTFLINSARGGLVVERDLVSALENGQIAGAGLDVFEEEPTPSNNPLFELDNVILSAHIAGTDDLSLDDMGLEAAQCIIDLFDGTWPAGSVVNDELRGRWKW